MLIKFYRDKEQLHFLLMLIVGTVATALIGLLFRSHVELLFNNTLIVGFMLLITGTILKLLTLFPEGDKNIKEMNAGDAVIIGLIQGLAVIPGISRSGSTIMASLWRGLDRKSAIRYSFMLSAPVIFGATVLEAVNVYQSTLDTSMVLNYLVGGLVAFIAGVIAIKLFIKLLVNKKFYYFAYYCFAVGITVILFSLLST